MSFRRTARSSLRRLGEISAAISALGLCVLVGLRFHGEPTKQIAAPAIYLILLLGLSILLHATSTPDNGAGEHWKNTWRRRLLFVLAAAWSLPPILAPFSTFAWVYFLLAPCALALASFTFLPRLAEAHQEERLRNAIMRVEVEAGDAPPAGALEFNADDGEGRLSAAGDDPD